MYSVRGPRLAPSGFPNFRWGRGDELFVYSDNGAREAARLAGADAAPPISADAGGSVALSWHRLSGARRRLATQLHATFVRLQRGAPDGEAQQLVATSREYRACVRQCIDELAADEAAARRAAGADAISAEADELAAELERHEWADCIMHLVEVFFIEPNAYVGEALVRWVQVHVAEPPAVGPLAAALIPERQEGYWPGLHRLLLHGRLAEARQLLGAHTELRAYAALGAPVRAGAGGEPSAGEALSYLDLLLENRPFLNSAEELLDFRGRWRAWREDAELLARRHERALPPGALTALRILRGDEKALLESARGWVELTLALALHAQPTLRRTEFSELVNYAIAQFPEEDYSDFDYILIDVMLDNPSAALDSIAGAYGRGWLLCHLADLLARAGQATPRAVDPSVADAADGATDHALALREYARGLAASPGLWQLAVDYLRPLPRALARAWVGAVVRAEEPTSDAKAHKLLALCAEWALEADGACLAAQMVSRKLRARMPAAALGWFGCVPPRLRMRARHDAIARALVDACEEGRGAGEGAAGGRAHAAAALARLVGGLVGAPGSAGGAALPETGWVAEYCGARAALDRLAALRAGAVEEGDDGRGGGGMLVDAEAEARALVLRLCSADGGRGDAAGGAADVPRTVRSQLLLDAHGAGILRDGPARPADATARPQLSSDDVYALIGCMHGVRPAGARAPGGAALAGSDPAEWAGLSAAMQPVALELCLSLSSVILRRPHAQP